MLGARVLGGPDRWEIAHGRAETALSEIPEGAIDFVLCDPIYPEVDRPYGRLTVSQWKHLMAAVVKECRRVLTPTGSAVFVLQSNSEKVGRVRPWLFEFQAWIAKTWNMVQDVYWWNHAAMPTVHCTRENGLLRPSLKACVWAGAPDCYRDQTAVLWEESDATKAARKQASARLVYRPSGHHMRQDTIVNAAIERGGTTPFNVLPYANTNSANSAGAKNHGAGTPSGLADWWIRYACPEGGVVLDPFCGSGTVGEVALSRGRRYLGIDADVASVEKAVRTCAGE